jgi:nucleoid DNA-binding protein
MRKMKEIPSNITKTFLCYYIRVKIKYKVESKHVLAVVSILFDEMIKDLKNGKIINIYNFGKLRLKQMKPRTYFHIVHRKLMHADGKKLLRFNLHRNLKTKLRNLLDLERFVKDKNAKKI